MTFRGNKVDAGRAVEIIASVTVLIGFATAAHAFRALLGRVRRTRIQAIHQPVTITVGIRLSAAAEARGLGLVGIEGARIEAVHEVVAIRITIRNPTATDTNRFPLVGIVRARIFTGHIAITIIILIGQAATANPQGSFAWVIWTEIDAIGSAVTIGIPVGDSTATVTGRKTLVRVGRTHITTIHDIIPVLITFLYTAHTEFIRVGNGHSRVRWTLVCAVRHPIVIGVDVTDTAPAQAGLSFQGVIWTLIDTRKDFLHEATTLPFQYLVGIIGALIVAIGCVIIVSVSIRIAAAAQTGICRFRGVLRTNVHAIRKAIPIIIIIIHFTATSARSFALCRVSGTLINAVRSAVIITVVITLTTTTSAWLSLVWIVVALVRACGSAIIIIISIRHATAALARYYLVRIGGTTVDAIISVVSVNITPIGSSTAAHFISGLACIIWTNIITIRDIIPVCVSVALTTATCARDHLGRVIGTPILAVRGTVIV
jgi:hypothetical protein